MRFVELEGSTRSMSLRGDLRAARALWRILSRSAPTCSTPTTPSPVIYGRVVGRLARRARVVVNTIHGLYATARRPARQAGGRLRARGDRQRASADAELVQNPEDLALMRRWRIAPRRKLRLLGNGVDLERFTARRSQTERGRATSRPRRRTRTTSWSAPWRRLVAEKGIPELIEAVGRLAGATVPAARSSVPRPRRSRRPRPGMPRPGRGRRRDPLGHRDDVDALYAAMDVFVPSVAPRGLPAAAMEAAATGLPVVATDVRGCRQVVERGVTGDLVPACDPSACARHSASTTMTSCADNTGRRRATRPRRISTSGALSRLDRMPIGEPNR